MGTIILMNRQILLILQSFVLKKKDYYYFYFYQSENSKAVSTIYRDHRGRYRLFPTYMLSYILSRNNYLFFYTSLKHAQHF